MTIQEFRQYCHDDSIQVTAHALQRMRERNITIEKINSCILNGEIIEEYPDAYPFPAALIMESGTERPLHIAAGIGDNELWVITAYYPDSEKWESDFKTGKENQS